MTGGKWEEESRMEERGRKGGGWRKEGGTEEDGRMEEGREGGEAQNTLGIKHCPTHSQ